MTIKELKTGLLRALQPWVEKKGFKLQKSKERFAKHLENGTCWFVLDFTVYEDLHVKPAICLRLHEVENIFHRTSGFERRYQPETPTLSLSVQSLMGDPSKFEYVLREAADVDSVASHINLDFEGVVVHYLEQHLEISQIDFVLNEDPEHDCVHYAMDYLRCAHGLIVARMVGRPNYDQLVDTYHRKLSLVSGGFYVPKFEALVADIATLNVRTK